MSYYTLFYKMFKYNQRKFLLYLLCDSFAVCILRIFAGFVMNKSFMNPNIVDPYISYNVFAPSFFITLFSAFFIPYSHEAFNRQQRKDHAVLMSIGSEEKIILRKILIENTFVTVVSVAIGLASGMACSFGIYQYLINVLRIPGLRYEGATKASVLVLAWFILLYGVSILMQLIYNRRQSIITLIKDSRVMRVGMRANRFLLLTGLVIMALTIVYMFVFLDSDHNNNAAICYLTGALGLALTIFNGTVFIDFLKIHRGGFYYRHIFTFSDLKYRFQSSKKMLSLAVCILGLVLFFQAFPFASEKLDERDLNSYYPHDIAYASIYGMNSPGADAVKKMAEKENVRIRSNLRLEYMVCEGNSLLPVSSVNKMLKRSYSIKQGECFFLYQELKNDGRIHHRSVMRELNISLKKGRLLNLKSAGHADDILVGEIRALGDVLILVSDEDYATVRSDAKERHIGNIHLIDCVDTKESARLGRVMKRAFAKDNERKGEMDGNFFKIELKYEGVSQAEQSYKFILFLFSCMDMLLYLAVIVMLHFKFMINFDADKKMLSGLIKIGTTSGELFKLVRSNLYIMFILPLLLAAIGASAFGYAVFNLSDMGLTYLRYSAVIGVGMLLIQSAVCEAYGRCYIRKIFGTATT